MVRKELAATEELIMKPLMMPCRIGGITIKNRVAMTAANLGWCYGGYVTDKVVSFYQKRAEGEVGLIIAGAAGVDPVRVNKVGMMQVYDDRFIPGLKKLTDAVHEAGSAIFLQLMHAGAYAKQSEHNGIKAVAPSPLHSRFTREEAKELTKEEIREIIGYFGDAAMRAKTAGFDGIELIGSAGYLISEFLSPATNKRTDEYGGTIENRVRFLTEVIDEVRSRVGDSYPVIVRLSGTDFVPGGNGPEEVVQIARKTEGKVDAFNITGGWHESSVPQITYNVPPGMYLYLARAVKDAVCVPVIGCNRLNIKVAENAVLMGDCDLAGMLRPLIADADIVRKYREGKITLIRPCLSCNQDCLERIFRADALGCAVNPYVGREGDDLQVRSTGKKILVVGAGVSGLAYAARMSSCNQVEIWEAGDNYGGSGKLVAKLPFRSDVGTYLNYLFRACIENHVKFCWGVKADAEKVVKVLKERRYDFVVIATGSRTRTDRYPRSPEARVISAEECIRLDLIRSSRIVVVGSGYKAVQTAQYCRKCRDRFLERRKFLKNYDPASEKFAASVMKWDEESITLLSGTGKIGQGFGGSTKWMMLEKLKEDRVCVEKNAVVLRIEKEGVVYIKTSEDGKKEERFLPADLVVMAEEWEKDSLPCELTEMLVPEDGVRLLRDTSGISSKIAFIGDCRRLGRISEAVRDAFSASEKRYEDTLR